MKQIYFFANGVTAVCDDAGKQVPEFQESWISLFVSYLESKGADPTQFQFHMPDGRRAEPFRTTDPVGWNWHIRG